jgi:hypothetical protein
MREDTEHWNECISKGEERFGKTMKETVRIHE